MTSAAAIGAALALGVGVPWLAIRMLAPALAEGRLVANYRGRNVFLGLGTAWLVWAGSAIIFGTVVGSALSAGDVGAGGPGGSVTQILTLAGPLALVAFALGLVDDAYGSSHARGFRGHLSALARGRLTTGGLKLIGISVASLVVGLVLVQIGSWVEVDAGFGLPGLATALMAGAAIALTSNFVNLVDLRPGRALKVYSLLGVLGVASSALWLPLQLGFAAESLAASIRALDVVLLLIFVFGPVAATWSLDLGERGMLGDAGANAMGAVAGLLIVIGLPLWGLGAYSALMLGLNLLSERVSFSRLIEGNTVLSRLDHMGRLSAEESSADRAD